MGNDKDIEEQYSHFPQSQQYSDLYAGSLWQKTKAQVKLMFFIHHLNIFRDAFRKQSNISDGAFCKNR